MILYIEGNLLQSPAQVLVNTVNTVGVMGKGIALEFKKLYPEMFKEYRKLCEFGKFKIGNLWLYKSSYKWVLNFPTKQHWRSPSRVEFIETGLQKFVATYANMGINSIAFPALGCGNGQLDFDTQVKPLMERYLRNLPIDVFVYPGIESKFLEHQHPDEMKNWLRSEPTNLPFAEVWEDLVELLSHRNEFDTIARNKPFVAKISDDPKGLVVLASSQKYFIQYDVLLAFWQQLRTHGFSMRQTAPGLDRQVSYLIPVFACLDYIMPVHMSDSYETLNNSAVIGLQVLPSAFIRQANILPQPIQLSLFEMNFQE